MQIRLISPLLLVALGVAVGPGAAAQLTVLNTNVPAVFAVTGFLQAATLKPGGAPNAGGTLTVNNITVIVPDNSVIQMPAHALTWAELFDPAAVGAGVRYGAAAAGDAADQSSGEQFDRAADDRPRAVGRAAECGGRCVRRVLSVLRGDRGREHRLRAAPRATRPARISPR